MIQIPTSELTRLLGDALKFAESDKDGHLHGVKLWWNGEALATAATDRLSGAVVTWTPNAGREGTDENAAEWHWGGGDEPWAVFLRVENVKELIKVFKLAPKFWFVPVTVKCSPTGAKLTVERADDTGHPNSLVVVPNDEESRVRFPDLAGRIDAAEELITGKTNPTDWLRIPAYRLGTIGSASVDGLMVHFGDDPEQPIVFRGGARFTAFSFQQGAYTHSDAVAAFTR